MTIAKALRLLVGILFINAFLQASPAAVTDRDRAVRADMIEQLKRRVHQVTLENGLRVVCVPADNTNVVTVGAFVEVGGAQKGGLAHIVEHMFFRSKGEQYLADLSARFGLRVGAHMNAFTFPDRTTYLFNTDNKNWQVFADFVADGLQQLPINEGQLHSELGVIMMELKARSADVNSLNFNSFLPGNHPYAHPIGGYKEEVAQCTLSDVTNFYEQYYTPDRITFFVCGAVQPEECFAYARERFKGFSRQSSQLPQALDLPFYAGYSSIQKTVYHADAYKLQVYCWLTPAQVSKESAALLSLASALSRRLSRKLVDERGCCLGAGAGLVPCRDAGLFMVQVVPKTEGQEFDFDSFVREELADVAQNGLSQEEFAAIYHGVTEGFVMCVENPTSLIGAFSGCYPLSGDVVEDYFSLSRTIQGITIEDIKQVASTVLRPFLMHRQTALPLPPEEKAAWQDLQARLALYDQALLEKRACKAGAASAEERRLVVPERKELDAPSVGDWAMFTLPNGVEVYWQSEAVSPRCACGVVVKRATVLTDSIMAHGKAPVFGLISKLLFKGIGTFDPKGFEELCASRGIGLFANGFSAIATSLKHNFEEALHLLVESLTRPALSADFLAMKKAEQEQAMALTRNDLGYQISRHLKNTLYASSPCVFSEEMELSHLRAVSLDDVKDVLSLLIDPKNIAVIMAGDLCKEEAHKLATKFFGGFKQKSSFKTAEVSIPVPTAVIDDVVSVSQPQAMVFAIRPTCVDDHADRAPLSLLDNYLNQKIYALRESTGLFYSAGASRADGSSTQVGSISLQVPLIPGNAAIVKDHLKALIYELFHLDPSEDLLKELKGAVLQQNGTYLNTPQAVVHVVATNILLGHSVDAKLEFSQKQQAVTLEQLREVIKRYFDPATWSFVQAGNFQ